MWLRLHEAEYNGSNIARTNLEREKEGERETERERKGDRDVLENREARRACSVNTPPEHRESAHAQSPRVQHVQPSCDARGRNQLADSPQFARFFGPARARRCLGGLGWTTGRLGFEMNGGGWWKNQITRVNDSLKCRLTSNNKTDKYSWSDLSFHCNSLVYQLKI